MSAARPSRGPVVMSCAAAAAAAAAGLSLQAAAAQGDAADYPRRPVRFLLGQAPGGGQDIIARALAAKLSETLGQTVIVDNRPGAGGTLATAIATKATPDGYSVLFVSSTFGKRAGNAR